MDYQICICVACQQRIEYPAELAGQTINCPTCSQALILPAATAPAVTEKRKGLFSGLMGFIDEVKEKKAHIELQRDTLAAFNRKLDLIVQDGRLEPHEVDQIFEALQFYRQTGFILSSLDARNLFLKIVSNIRWFEETDALVERLRDGFGVSVLDGDIMGAIHRGRERFRIECGDLQPIHVPGLIMKSGEQAFWSEPAALIEERVVRRRYEGGSHGVSFRVMKGVSFRVGASRGHSVSDVADVPVSTGNLILTTQRFYFAGDRKNFSIPLRELAQVEFDFNSLTLFEERRDKPRTVRFADSSRCELFQAVITGLSRKVANLEGAASQIGI